MNLTLLFFFFTLLVVISASFLAVALPVPKQAVPHTLIKGTKGKAASSAGMTSPEMDSYHGMWRHILLPKHSDTPPVDPTPPPTPVQPTASSSSVPASGSSSSMSAAGAAAAKISSDVSPAFSLHHARRYSSYTAGDSVQQLPSERPLQEAKRDDEWPDEEPFAVSLDLSLDSLKPLLFNSNVTGGGKKTAPAKLVWRRVPFAELQDLSQDNDDDDDDEDAAAAARPSCTARLVGNNLVSKANSNNNNNNLMPQAVEFSCTNLERIMDTATRNVQLFREQIKKQRREEEELRQFIERSGAKTRSSASYDDDLPMKQQQQRRKLQQQQQQKRGRRRGSADPDFDAEIPPFQFLKWNDSSLMYPLASVAAVIHDRGTSPDSERWFEGAASACIETRPRTTVEDWYPTTSSSSKKSNKNKKNVFSRRTGKLINPVSQSNLRVIVELSHFSRFRETELPVTSVQQLADRAAMSVRLKLTPLGSRSPMRRQLVRWLRFPGLDQVVPQQQQQQQQEQEEAESSDTDDYDDEEEMRKQQEQSQRVMEYANSTVFFPLRATERRLTRVGLGFRARLRRQEQINKSSNHQLQPTFSRWSIEVFRRVPRPRVECVAIFSRLMSIPSIFQDHSSSASEQREEEEEERTAAVEKNKKKKKEKKPSLVDEHDPFDDDDDDDEEDEEVQQQPHKRGVRNKRLLAAERRFHQSFPGMDTIEESTMQLVSVHQLRGLLDAHFSVPELVKMSPVTAVPSGPAIDAILHQQPKTLEAMDEGTMQEEVVRAEKLPPRGLYVLYVSEERPREHALDVEVNHADFHFIAPLKLEKRLKSHNLTFHGQYERLPLPQPPRANWTWYDAANVSLQVVAGSGAKKTQLDLALGGDAATIRAKQKEIELRAVLPRLLFQYHNDSRFPGFSITVEQSRPLDDLQIWICDGKNDTLFLDEERHVPFTVKQHVHDKVNAPLFGWRFALDSQRAFALDTLYVSVAFRLRRAAAINDDDSSSGGWLGSAGSKRRARLAPPDAAEYSEVLAHWAAGREAARHLVSWVNEHRWLPLTRGKQPAARQRSAVVSTLPAFPNFPAIQREQLLGGGSGTTQPLSESLRLEPDPHGGAWRLVAARSFAPGEDLFTLPWGVLLRHTQAPRWISELVDCAAFEQLLRRHDQYIINSDHVDLDTAATFEQQQRQEDDDDDQKKSEKTKKKKKMEVEESKVESSAYLRKVRASLKQRRDLHHSNIKAWTILALMHWAQAEPEMGGSSGGGGDGGMPQEEWLGSSAAVRWHAHYRMFTERIKGDGARWLRKHVVAKFGKKKTKRSSLEEKNATSTNGEQEMVSDDDQVEQQQQQQQSPAERFLTDEFPSQAWSPLKQSLLKRADFLHDVADYLLGAHSGLPRSFCGGSLQAADWFASAFTLIEARALLVNMGGNSPSDSSSNNKNPRPEWVYIPLLDLASPNSDSPANLEASIVSSSGLQDSFAIRISSSSSSGAGVSAGSPLVYGGWSSNGARTTQHGLELFGRVSSRMMGLTNTSSALLPFGPVLISAPNASQIPKDNQQLRQIHAELLRQERQSRQVVMAECAARCRRVAGGMPVSVNDDGGELTAAALEKEEVKSSSQQEQTKLTSCCDESWLLAVLRRRWRQAAAQQLLWALGPELLLKKMLYANIQSSAVSALAATAAQLKQQQKPSSSSSSSGTSSDKKFEEQLPPMWKESRLHLTTSTLKTLEAHLRELEEQEPDKTKSVVAGASTNLEQRLRLIFGQTDSEQVVLGAGGDDGLCNEEVQWFGCCQRVSQNDDADPDL